MVVWDTFLMRTVDLIVRKRAAEELSPEEIAFLVDGYTSGEIPDYQMSAFLMATFFTGMTDREVSVLTDCMIRSGGTIDLSSIPGPKVDKHSTGGVGDKTSLISAPIAAAAGVIVPMMSGRALGHTGGTLDKLESIPGFQTALSQEQFLAILSQHGLAFIGQSDEITPADKNSTHFATSPARWNLFPSSLLRSCRRKWPKVSMVSSST
jgi:pyrimidine-nucleoside phosphorylase